MKHRNPTRQHALLALLASLSLSGCQWDSVLYDSYIAAFGESGAGGYAECPGMEYILIRDTTTKDENNDNTEDGNTENNNDGDDTNKESNYIKLYRSTCCITNEDGSCTLRENALEINKYCIAFQFNKCPLTASRCMTETITITNSLEDTGEPKETEQNYCAEIVCASGEIECYIQYKKEGEEKEKTSFKCINPSSNDTCNASCPTITLTISDEQTLQTELSEHFNDNRCINGAECQPDSESNSYAYKCPDGFVFCNGKCINPQTDTDYCGAYGKCDDSSKGEKCDENFRCHNGTCCNQNESNCDNTIKCKDGYRYCMANDNQEGRVTPTCLPTTIDKELFETWKTMNLHLPDTYKEYNNDITNSEFSCACKYGYYNRDGLDANGCEAVTLKEECGIINNTNIETRIINCLDKFNASDAICNKDNYLCELNTCAQNYLLVENNEENKDYIVNTPEDLNRLNKKGCRQISNECCFSDGKKCIPCSIGEVCKRKNESINPQEYECVPNDCPAETISCFSGCFPEELLNAMHMNKDCTCQSGYKLINGYCERVETSQPYSCGSNSTNCYETLKNVSKPLCEASSNTNNNNYVCTYKECNANYCDWDNNPANGCETSLPKGFKDCNTCENNAIFSSQNNNKRCIRKGNGWSNKYWTVDYVNYYCDDCSSGDYCCIEYSHFGSYGVCGNKSNCN